MLFFKIESWGVKGRFPPTMKPLLAQVALKAIRLNEYDDNFFNLMPRLFPYNRFTMSVRSSSSFFRSSLADHAAVEIDQAHGVSRSHCTTDGTARGAPGGVGEHGGGRVPESARRVGKERRCLGCALIISSALIGY